MKRAPTSLRIPPETEALVHAWADKRGLARNAAYVELIRRGLEVTAPPAVAARQPKLVSPAPRKHVSRLKGEWKAP